MLCAGPQEGSSPGLWRGLAVGIRTFWIERDHPRPQLRFGTGAGIIWDSDPEREWHETELKASRLLAVASGEYDDHETPAHTR